MMVPTLCAGDTERDMRDVYCVRSEHPAEPWHLGIAILGGSVQTTVWCEHCGCLDAEHLTYREMVYEGRIVEHGPEHVDVLAGYCRTCEDCPAQVEDADSLRALFRQGVVA